jgi:hypothetical protein
MRFLLRPSTHAFRGLLDFALRALLVSFAGVSTAWLYRQVNICQRIQTLRPDNLLPQPSKVAASQQMKAIYATLKKRLKVVEAENLELKKQLEVLYGVLHKNENDKNK